MFNPQPKPIPTEKKKRKRIAYRSKKRAAQETEYCIMKDKYLEEHPVCEVCHKNKSIQIHHMKGRIGPLLIDDRFFLATDFKCHEKIENEPIWALENGYSLRRI